MIKGERNQGSNPSDTNLTRRQFLRLSKAAGAIGTAALTLYQIDRLAGMLKLAPPVEVLLKQTATVLENTGQQSTFKEEGGFTKEMFERIRRSTFIAEVYTTRNVEGVDKLYSILSTCWLARSGQNVHYFVTARHGVYTESTQEVIKQINFWRPGLDSQKFIPRKVHAAATDIEQDIVVLRCEGELNTEGPVDALPWQDDVLLKKDDKILTVGFPREFKDPDSDLGYFTLASVLTVEKDANYQSGLWHAQALVNFGNSGSPVVLNIGGQNKVVGILIQNATSLARDTDKLYRSKNISIGRSFNLTDLIGKLDRGEGTLLTEY